MNLDRRLKKLEQSLKPLGTDTGDACDTCGAPCMLERRGLWFIDERDDRTCVGCNRHINPVTGRPLIIKTLVSFGVLVPPAGWVRREYCPSANGENSSD